MMRCQPEVADDAFIGDGPDMLRRATPSACSRPMT